MDIFELYDRIISEFTSADGVKELLDEKITVIPSDTPEKTLMPDHDPPSLVNRPEYCVTAMFKGFKGEAYTEVPESFEGSVREAVSKSPDKDGIKAVTISAINAVMNYLGKCPGTFPEDIGLHEKYAQKIYDHVSEHYGKKNIVLVGYDGYIVKKFVEEEMDFWTMDRNPDNITKDRFNHVIVNSAKLNRECSIGWAKLLIITGSTLCNGTITQYLDCGKDLLFYGITGSSVCTLLNLPWIKP